MNVISFWLKNARSISLPQSLLPALTAIAAASDSDTFSWFAAVIAVAGIALLHLGMNLTDDLFDYKVQSGKMREQLAALIIGFSYSGSPLRLGFRGLGEVVIFIMFGPLLMSGCYYAAAGEMNPEIIWLSAAVGLLVTNIVYSHSVMDAAPDSKVGKRTMAHVMGTPRAMILLSALLNILPYALIALGCLLGQLNAAYLATVACLPLSLWLVGSLNDFALGKQTEIKPRKWMGPMGDFDKYRKAGIDWFMLRWLTARNIVTFFCLIIIVVSIVL